MDRSVDDPGDKGDDICEETVIEDGLVPEAEDLNHELTKVNST